MKIIEYNHYTDRDIVNAILRNDKSLIEWFFQNKCSKIFSYILYSVFDDKIDKRELVNELYLFMAQNDWQVFRNFQFRSSLMTYITVIAVRFFQKKRLKLIDSISTKELNDKLKQEFNMISSIEQRIDLNSALNKMPNGRYRQVIEKLDLKDVQPKILAKEMNITVDNLYNIHRRALVQLRLVMDRKEDYYG